MLPIGEWSGITEGTAPRRAAASTTRTATEVWFSVWNAKDQQIAPSSSSTTRP